MSSGLELSATELALAAALTQLRRASTPAARERAQLAVDRARQRLEQLRNTPAPKEPTCCCMPMTWHQNLWICTRGHD